MSHSAEFICKVNITYDRGPYTDTMSPTVAMNGDVRIILTWGRPWAVDSSSMIALLVDFYCKVYHFVVEINFHATSGFHDLLILGKDHVLGEVILC